MTLGSTAMKLPGETDVTGAFAMIDMIGFSNRMDTGAPEQVRDQFMWVLVRSAYEASAIVNHHLRYSGRNGLQWLCASDTVILWVPELSTPKPHITIGHMVDACRLLLALGFLRNIPMRGAISYGRALLSREPAYYIGPAIAEAHRLEQRQNWAGVALCQSARNIHGAREWSDMFTLEWPVPIKPEGHERLLVVDWPGGILHNVALDWESCFPPSADPRHIEIRRGTVEFFNNRPKVHVGPMFGPDAGTSVPSDWRDTYLKLRADESGAP